MFLVSTSDWSLNLKQKRGRKVRLKYCDICLFSTRYPKNKQKTSPQDKKILVTYICHYATAINDWLNRLSFF